MHFHNDEKWRFHRWRDSTSRFKDELAEVFIMARQCPTLCERSGGWGQKHLTLLLTPWHSLGWRQLAANRAILSAYSWLGTGKHNVSDKRSKPCCPTPSQSKSGNSLFWRSWVSAAVSHLAHLSWFFPNLLPKCLNDTISTQMSSKAVQNFSWVSRIRAWFTKDWILGLRCIC